MMVHIDRLTDLKRLLRAFVKDNANSKEKDMKSSLVEAKLYLKQVQLVVRIKPPNERPGGEPFCGRLITAMKKVDLSVTNMKAGTPLLCKRGHIATVSPGAAGYHDLFSYYSKLLLDEVKAALGGPGSPSAHVKPSLAPIAQTEILEFIEGDNDEFQVVEDNLLTDEHREMWCEWIDKHEETNWYAEDLTHSTTLEYPPFSHFVSEEQLLSPLYTPGATDPTSTLFNFTNTTYTNTLFDFGKTTDLTNTLFDFTNNSLDFSDSKFHRNGEDQFIRPLP